MFRRRKRGVAKPATPDTQDSAFELATHRPPAHRRFIDSGSERIPPIRRTDPVTGLDEKVNVYLSHSSSSESVRRLRAWLAVAFILLLLGLGNVMFGEHKRSEYIDLLQIANASDANDRQQRTLPILTPTIGSDRQAEYLRRVQARIDFYNLVILGGRGFFAVAGIVLLMCLVNARRVD